MGDMTIIRHPSESWGHSPQSAPKRHEIPAFAGMTR